MAHVAPSSAKERVMVGLVGAEIKDKVKMGTSFCHVDRIKQRVHD